MRKKLLLLLSVMFLLLFGAITVSAEPKSNGLEVSPNPAAVGDEIVLKGSASGTESGTASYRYIYYDGISWQQAASSDHVEDAVWVPAKAGSYLFSYQVGNTNSFCAVVVQNPSLKIDSVKTSSGTDSVSIEAGITTNVSAGRVTYTFQIYDLQNKTWSTLLSNSDKPLADWHPKASGSYWIHVIAKIDGTKAATSTIGYTVKGASVTGLTISPAGGQAVKKTVKLDGSVENPLGEELTYEYLVYNGSVWNRISKSSTLDYATWTPDKAGSYLVCFQAYDAAGNCVGQSFQGYTVTDLYVETGAITTDASTPGAIICSITPDTNDDDATYRWQIYDLQKKSWSTIRDWSTEPNTVWNPTDTGSYWICVQGKTCQGTVDQRTIGYRIQSPSLTSFEASPKGAQDVNRSVTLSATADNPINQTLKYQYLYYDGSYWRQISLDDTLHSVTWTPTKAGTYTVGVQIFDTNGKAISQKFTSYTINDLYMKVGSIQTSFNNAGGIDCSITPSTNDDNAVYTWQVYDLSMKKWQTIQGASTATSVTWIPEKTGNYWIHAEGKTVDGKKSAVTISFNVPSVEATKLKTSMESPVAAYNTITLSGEVKNPLAHTLKYRYIIYDGKNWKELQASDTLTTYDWKPDKAGNYILGFEVTDTNTNEVTNFLKVYSIQALDTKLGNMNCYTGDYKTYLFRQLVTSNDPGLTYKYQLYDQQTKVWSTMKDYINPDKVSWNPASSGDYLVNVTITGSDGSTYTNAIGVNVCGYKIASFGFHTNLQAGVPADLTLTGIDALNEGYTFKYYSYNLTTEKWDEIYSGNTPQAVSQTFAVSGYYAYKANVYRTSDGKIVDSTITYINPSNFLKNGWYYENGYKLYYKNGVLQTDLDGILPFQDSYYIEVNRSCCTVTIYAKDGDNGYIIPVHVFACSVGLPTSDMETPTGYFHTLAKYRWAELMGPSYGQYCTRIVGSILFHSVAGSNTTSYNLSAGEYNKLGSPASHGCVRLNVINAKWIYDHCALGTTVHIFDSAYPGPLGYGATIKIPATQNWDPTDPNVP